MSTPSASPPPSIPALAPPPKDNISTGGTGADTPRSGTSTPHVLANAPGYTTPPFAGKDSQRRAVESALRQGGFIPSPLVAREVAWFYEHLGIDDTYFAAESPSQVADHVLALFGAKLLAFTKHDPNALTVELENVRPDGSGATFIHTSEPGVTASAGPGATCERR